MNIHNRRYDDKQHDCTGIAITLILLIAFTLVFHEEIWMFIDWVLTVEENFNGRHQ